MRETVMRNGNRTTSTIEAPAEIVIGEFILETVMQSRSRQPSTTEAPAPGIGDGEFMLNKHAAKRARKRAEKKNGGQPSVTIEAPEPSLTAAPAVEASNGEFMRETVMQSGNQPSPMIIVDGYHTAAPAYFQCKLGWA